MRPLVSTRPAFGVSNEVSHPVDGGHPDAVPFGAGLSRSGVASVGALVSGDVEEGVEEEVSDALPEGGRLDEGGRPDELGGARGVEA